MTAESGQSPPGSPAAKTAPSPKPSRRRRLLVYGIIALTGLLLLVSTLTVWAKRQLLDTDVWVASTTELLANPDVQSTLSTYLVNQLYNQGDVTARLEQALPPAVKGLAAPAAAGLQEVAVRVANRILAAPRTQALWEALNRQAHERLVFVLEGRPGKRLTTDQGNVVLDLQPLVTRVATRLGVEAKLSPDAGKITIMRADQLAAAQKAVRVLKVLSSFMAIACLGLIALAIYLGRGRRRETLRAVGETVLLVGVVVLVVRRLVGHAVISSLVGSESVRPAVKAVWVVETEVWKEIAVALIVLGGITVAGAWAAGPTRPAIWLRRTIAPFFRHAVPVYATFAVAYLLVLLWGPTEATRRLVGILVLGALAVVGIELLRRQTAREFPPPEEEPVAGSAAPSSDSSA